MVSESGILSYERSFFVYFRSTQPTFDLWGTVSTTVGGWQKMACAIRGSATQTGLSSIAEKQTNCMFPPNIPPDTHFLSKHIAYVL